MSDIYERTTAFFCWYRIHSKQDTVLVPSGRELHEAIYQINKKTPLDMFMTVDHYGANCPEIEEMFRTGLQLGIIDHESPTFKWFRIMVSKEYAQSSLKDKNTGNIETLVKGILAHLGRNA